MTATMPPTTTPTTRKPCGRIVAPAPTYSAVESLPDGRTRVLVAGLRLAQMLAWRPDGQTWAVSWREDAPSSPAVVPDTATR